MTAKTLNLHEIADRYTVTTATIRAWAKAGKIPHLRLPGGEYRFRPSDIEAFEDTCLVADLVNPTTASTSDEAGTPLSGPKPTVERDPFRRGRLSVVRPKSGGTNG